MAQRVVIPGFRKIETSGGGEGTGNYNDLQNKPSINNVSLVGNLNTVNLKLTDATLTEEGVPAESKTVGEKLEEQSSNLIQLKKETTVNLLNPTLQTTTLNGVTCTNNGDGTYTLDGIARANTIFFITSSNTELSNILIADKTYRLVGNSKKSTIRLVLKQWNSTWNDLNTSAYDLGEGTNVKINPNAYYVRCDVNIESGVTCNNLVLKPMLTTNLDATYDDFVPYTGNTGNLNSDVASLLKRIEALEARITKTDTTVTK